MIKKVNCKNELTKTDFLKIDSGELAALVIEGSDLENCSFWEQKIKQNKDNFMDKLDASFYQTGRTSQEGYKKYWDNSDKYKKSLVKLSINLKTPDDLIKQTLASVFGTCNTLRLENDKILCPSVFRKWKDVHIPRHHDILHEEIPESKEAKKILRQFAINYYMSVGEQGGEVILYLKDLNSLDENSKGISYKPKVGDLTIFNSRYAHEVKPFKGTRITCSAFAGLKNDNDKIYRWA